MITIKVSTPPMPTLSCSGNAPGGTVVATKVLVADSKRSQSGNGLPSTCVTFTSGLAAAAGTWASIENEKLLPGAATSEDTATEIKPVWVLDAGFATDTETADSPLVALGVELSAELY